MALIGFMVGVLRKVHAVRFAALKEKDDGGRRKFNPQSRIAACVRWLRLRLIGAGARVRREQ